MTSDIFSTDPVEAQVDETKEVLEELVGEGKKYKTAEDLAKSRIHADAHITNLESELKEMREELNKRLTAEEILEKIREQKTVSTQEETPVVEAQNTESSPTPDLKTIEQLLEDKLKMKSAQEREQSNLAQVNKKAQDQWGATAQVEIQRKAQELGMTVEQLQEYAKTSPSVFYRLVGLEEQTQRQPGAAPVSSSVDQTRAPSTSGVKNQSYYNRIKKEDPKRYFSREIQVEMHDEALKQGENFFN